MKGKNLSKVLAFLLAAVMIFSALPLMAFASDETANIYTVSNESPAIPMTAGTKIAVADLAVTFSDGTVVAGDALTWASSADSVVIEDGYIIAKEAGPVKLTVTAEGKTRNVYAAVATKEDAAKGLYKFYTYDFANGMGDEWVVDTAYSGTKTKNPWTYNEQGQLILGTATSKQMSYSKTKIDPVTGQFVPATYDPAKQYPSAIWIDTPYFYGSKYASTMEEAFDKGILTSALYNKAVNLGAYIPFVNTVDNDKITYYKEDGTTATKGNMTQTGSYMYSKNPMFNEFTNYTSGAKVLTVFIGTKDEGVKFSMLGRVTYGTQHIHEYIGLQINAHDTAAAKGVSYTRAAASDSSQLWFHLSNYGQTPTAISGLEFSALKSSSANLANSSEFVEITTKFHDKNMTITSGEETITTDCSSISRNPDVRAGSIGIAGHHTSFAVKEMYAAINSEYLVNIPEAIEVYYTVSYGAPAIPMNVNTAVDLDFINVEMDKNGTVVSGEKIVWDAAKQEGLYLNKKDNKVSVYTAGNYKLTATYNGVSKNVWVVVKTAAETEWVLYDKTFEKEVLPEDWTVQTYLKPNYSDKITTVYPDVTNPNPGFTPVRVHETNDNYLWSTHGFFTLNNEVVSSFADYTIDVNAVFFGHIHGTGYIYGRTNTTNGLLTLDSELQGFEIDNRNDYGIPYYTVFHNTSKKSTKIYEGTDWTVSKTVANQQYQATQDNFVVKFAGDTLSVYEADDKTEAHTFTATGITQKPGTVGIAAFILGQGGDAKSAGGWTKIEDIKITLNNTADDMPISEAAEPKPEEPEAKINITGSGDAEVEAVVGSDNTYTVALAPAVGYKVKTLSLIVNGDMRANLNHDNTGLVYTFTSEDLNATTISVEYIPDDGTFNTVMAGASVWEERSAIRFGARTDLIKRSTTNTAVGTLDNRIKVGDTVYEITEIGMLLIPKGLFEGELTVDTKNVARQQVTKVVTLTDTFSDIAINLVGIPTSYYDVEICSRMYVAYEVDGETRYVYTDVIVRTYNQVLEAIGK